MKKTIKLTESDLSNLVKKIIKEQRANRFDNEFDKRNGYYYAAHMGLDTFPGGLRNYSDDVKILLLPNNNITEIPEWISEFRNLQILNLTGNPISRIPNSISELDPENGGSLYSLGINNPPTKLKQLLPSVSINYN